mmetsp:Transcript_13156/g.20712  ORF Transcript_13156/g.20712 Transcript_13156/m.20712 type:complete len:121 (-) Transcript_13156:249-611(-)
MLMIMATLMLMLMLMLVLKPMVMVIVMMLPALCDPPQLHMIRLYGLSHPSMIRHTLVCPALAEALRPLPERSRPNFCTPLAPCAYRAPNCPLCRVSSPGLRQFLCPSCTHHPWVDDARSS